MDGIKSLCLLEVLFYVTRTELQLIAISKEVVGPTDKSKSLLNQIIIDAAAYTLIRKNYLIVLCVDDADVKHWFPKEVGYRSGH